MRALLAALIAFSLSPIALAPAAAQLRWDGTAPFCSGSCSAGEVEVTRRSTAPSNTDPIAQGAPPFGHACATGTKALCRKAPGGASCHWSGTAPICKGGCSSGEVQATPPPGSSSGSSCWTGHKVYCCSKFATSGVPLKSRTGVCEGTAWTTTWQSASGPFHSSLAVMCAAAGTGVTAYYDNGRIDGTLIGKDGPHPRIVGTWKRVAGGSGGKCDYGNVALTVAQDGRSFAGRWSYCHDPMAMAGSSWDWAGTR